VLVALWLAYAASPFVGVCRLVEVIGQRDVPRAARIATQIARTYLRITGTGGDPVH